MTLLAIAGSAFSQQLIPLWSLCISERRPAMLLDTMIFSQTAFDADDRLAGLTEGLKVASERLSWGFSRGAKALTGSRHASDSLSAQAKRALRAAPQVCFRMLDEMLDVLLLGQA